MTAVATTKKLFIFTFLAALIPYLLTMPSGLTWAHFGVDGGELISAAVTFGTAHPPGYPLYILIGKLFSFLPIGSIAYRFNLMSAVSMALAAAFATLTTYAWLPAKTNQNAIGAIVIGLTFAYAKLVWQQAIITEVYGLFLLFFSLTVWATVTHKGNGWLGFLWGLTITSHLSGIFLGFICLWQPLKKRDWPLFGVGLAFGLTPFLLLPLFALSNSPIIWGDPSSLAGWIEIVTANIYQALPFQLPFDQIAVRLTDWGPQWLSQFSLAGLPLLLVSLWQLRKEKEQIVLIRLWFLTAVCHLLYALLYNSNDAIVFSLPALLLLAILLTKGVLQLRHWSLLLPLTLLLLNFRAVNISQDQLVPQQLEQLLLELPQYSIIETSGEPILFSLWYVKFVEKQSVDTLIVDNQLFAFSWYRKRLRAQEADLIYLDSDDIEQFRQQFSQTRPYCMISLDRAGNYSCSSLNQKQ